MVTRLTSRRSVLAGVSSVLVAGTGGCLGNDPRYQTIFRNDSSNSVTGTVRLETQNETAPAETTIDLSSDSSMSLVVAKRPTATAIDIDRNSGQSIFNWTDIPSCRIGGLPTQTITVDDDSIGVEYGCKRHDE